MKITHNTVDEICSLALALRQWKDHSDDLQADGPAPSQATVASIFKTISGRIHELKKYGGDC